MSSRDGDGTPWVSVVMPTYNGARYLGEAMESLLAQVDDDMEVIAVDDGSTDATVSLLESYAGRLPLRIIRRPHAGNWVANSNHGLNLARGGYISILHQDDLWEPNRLAVLRSALRDQGAASFVIHPSWYIDDHGRKVGLLRCPVGARSGGCCTRVGPAELFGRLLVQNFIAMPGHLFSREAALRLRGLDEALWYTADWDYWLRLAAEEGAVHVPQALARCRVHPASQTMRPGTEADDLGRQLRTVLERHLPTWDVMPASAGRRGQAIRRAARASVAINEWLSRLASRRARPSLALLAEVGRLGPLGLRAYWKYAALGPRVMARLWAGVLHWGAPPARRIRE